MGTAEQYTKRKINEVTVFSELDEEYKKRILEARSIDDIRSILRDFEEFLPDGLQKFRSCDDESEKEIVNQIKRYQYRIKHKQKLPMDPTEATMFIAPPMLTIPRMLALAMTDERNRTVTWGEAFVKLMNEGHIEKLRNQQEYMYKQIIDAKERVSEVIDTESFDAPTIDGGNVKTEEWSK